MADVWDLEPRAEFAIKESSKIICENEALFTKTNIDDMENLLEKVDKEQNDYDSGQGEMEPNEKM